MYKFSDQSNDYKNVKAKYSPSSLLHSSTTANDQYKTSYRTKKQNNRK